MKTSNKILLGTFIFLLLSAYSIIIAARMSFEKVERVEGNGKVVNADRAVESFDALYVSGSFDVFLTQGSPSLKVEAEENLMEFVRTEIKNGVLKIEQGNGRHFANTKAIRVYVSAENLKSIKVTSAADLWGDSIFVAEKLHVGCSGSGEAHLNLQVEKLDVKANSAGYIVLKGTANELELQGSGSGEISAFDLLVNKANFSVTSAASAKLSVSEYLSGQATASGTVLFKGSPTKDVSTAASGSVEQVN